MRIPNKLSKTDMLRKINYKLVKAFFNKGSKYYLLTTFHDLMINCMVPAILSGRDSKHICVCFGSGQINHVAIIAIRHENAYFKKHPLIIMC